MRLLTALLLAAASISGFAVLKSVRMGAPCKNAKVDSSIPDIDKATMAILKRYTADLKSYSVKNNFNTRYCFLINMKMASGSKRFFIYDLKNDSILQAGLVTHGSGIKNLTDSILFSNDPGSNCSSLGKYKIGRSYYGKFGLAWKLHGLDNTNSNAFNRFVVLHSHPCVPDNEIAAVQICMSWGCPTISPLFLNEVKGYLDRAHAPILLWIFN